MHYSLLNYKTKCVTVSSFSFSSFAGCLVFFGIKDPCEPRQQAEEAFPQTTYRATRPHQHAGKASVVFVISFLRSSACGAFCHTGVKLDVTARTNCWHKSYPGRQNNSSSAHQSVSSYHPNVAVHSFNRMRKLATLLKCCVVQQQSNEGRTFLWFPVYLLELTHVKFMLFFEEQIFF